MLLTFCSSSLAHDVFREALAVFSSELTKDAGKIKWIMESEYGNLDEVLVSVRSAQVDYERRRADSKAREALAHLSEKLLFYSGVMDVMIQQYPEYTSLAWGAMKFLFVVRQF